MQPIILALAASLLAMYIIGFVIISMVKLIRQSRDESR